MAIILTPNEARVLGCLMEKMVVTPEQYPLTLNALTNACNQKSSRNPVMSLDPGTVQNTVRSLQDQHLVAVDQNFKSQVEKYTQRLCNTPFSTYQFEPPQFSIVCTLLLRGPRTPGELRANSGRLYHFADNAEVQATLETLLQISPGPLVTRLPRTPGRRDAEYMHLLSGEISGDAEAAQTPTQTFSGQETAAETVSSPPPAPPGANEDLNARVTALEANLAALMRKVETLEQNR